MRNVLFTVRALCALRGNWLTCDEFAKASGRTRNHARVWLEEFVREGMARSRHRKTGIDPQTGNHPSGPKPREYTLESPSQWGGL